MLQNENEANVGHGDDIADIEDHKELCQRIMDMEFVSEAAAYDFYNRFAAKRGFGIRKSRSKETKCAKKIRRKRRMVCFKERRRNKKLLTMDNRTYRLRAETRCGCKAEMVVNLNRKRGIWYVSKFNDKHNHQFALPDEVPFLWSHRKIKDFQKAEILAMSAIGVRKHVIMANFIGRFGGYGKVGFMRKDLYNMCSREKRKLLADGDATTAIAMLEMRKKKYPDFFSSMRLIVKGI